MIAALGFASIIIFLYTTMTKKLSIQAALIGIPVIAALIGGFGLDIGKMMINGVLKVTPSAMIPIFAVMYFGLMIDAGLFDPMVNRILKLVKGDPVKITIGAAVLAMIAILLMDVMPMATIFMIGFAIALTVNYPRLDDQTARLKNYAGEVLMIVALIFSAGCFTGILSETKMVAEMAKTLVPFIPAHMGSFLPLAVAVTSMPLSLVFPTDAYYFGVLPVIYEMAVPLGVDPVEVGRAAVLGQMTVGFPLSPLAAATLVLISLSRVDLVDHQKFIFLWAFGSTLVMTAVCYLTGALTF